MNNAGDLFQFMLTLSPLRLDEYDQLIYCSEQNIHVANKPLCHEHTVDIGTITDVEKHIRDAGSG